jgi:hypothetical protein
MISNTWSQIAQPEKHNSNSNSPMNVLNRTTSISNTPGATALSFYKNQASNAAISKEIGYSASANNMNHLLDQSIEENTSLKLNANDSILGN